MNSNNECSYPKCSRQIKGAVLRGKYKCSICENHFCDEHLANLDYCRSFYPFWSDEQIKLHEGVCLQCAKTQGISKILIENIFSRECAFPNCTHSLSDLATVKRLCVGCGMWFCSSHFTTDGLKLGDGYCLDCQAEHHHGCCSWCFIFSGHRLRERNTTRRNVYQCNACHHTTLICRVPGCRNMVKSEKKWDSELCASHDGTIASFRQLSMRIQDVDEYPKLFKRKITNVKKIGQITACAIGGAAVIGPLSFVAAPAVGGAIGSTFFGLTGAAATSQGLAALGLGAISAGGMGMAGGLAVVTAVGGGVGGVMSGVVANAYIGDIEGFKITCIKKGKSPGVIVINGFLTQDAEHPERQWLDVLGNHYPQNAWYLLEWESQRLKEIAEIALGGAGKQAFEIALMQAAEHAMKTAAGKLNPLGGALGILGLASNPWHVAMVKAAQTGTVLSDILARTPENKNYILLGHSLGARVIYYTLQALSGRNSYKVSEAHLFGGAVGNDPTDWEKSASAVEDRIHNYYSKNDSVLRLAYKAGNFFLGSTPIGLAAIPTKIANIENHDVSEFVDGHTEYKTQGMDFFNQQHQEGV